MKKTYLSNRPLLIALLLTFLFVGVVAADITAGFATQLSLSTANGAPSGSSGSPDVPVNGGVLVFNSTASNLISSDKNSLSDVFARDLSTGVISRVSVSSGGDESRGGNSIDPAISPVAPDGFYAIAFTSFATNLGSIFDQSSISNIFLHVPSIGLTDVVDVTAAGVLGNGPASAPSITTLQNPSRALIVFASDANNLVSDDKARVRDIFLATVEIPATAAESNPAQQTTIERISVGAGGVEADGDSDYPKISGDGRYIVFVSEATNLIAGSTITKQQVYRYSLETEKIELVSKNSSGTPADQIANPPSISYAGRYVAYATSATNILTGGLSGKDSVLVHDLVKGTITRASTDSSGNISNGSAALPAVSANGRFVSFSDSGSNLVSDDTNSSTDVFIKDLDSGATARLSVGSSGEASDDSDSVTVAGSSYNSLDALVYFRSLATNLTSTASGAGDIFFTNAILAAPQLKKGTRIETPADISIVGKRSVIRLQKFSFPSSSALVVKREGAAAVARAGKRAITYEVQVRGTGKRKNVRQTLIAKRNTVTTPKLKPGIYTTRYRATAAEGGKVVSKTPFSPRQTFQIS